MLEIDARPLLPLIHAPTLVLHRTGNPLAPIEHGHYLAERIPDAKLIELPGSDGPLPWQADIAPDHIEEFLGSLRRPPAPPGYWRPCCLPTSSRPPSRPAGSGIGAGVSCWTCTTSWPAGSLRSSRAAHQDDRLWDSGHLRWSRREIRCAAALRDELRGIGLQIRAGLHTGEVKLRYGGVGGIAVHLAARVMAAAGSGEVFVSRKVGDLVVGSTIPVEDRVTPP